MKETDAETKEILETWALDWLNKLAEQGLLILVPWQELKDRWKIEDESLWNLLDQYQIPVWREVDGRSRHESNILPQQMSTLTIHKYSVIWLEYHFYVRKRKWINSWTEGCFSWTEGPVPWGIDDESLEKAQTYYENTGDEEFMTKFTGLLMDLDEAIPPDPGTLPPAPIAMPPDDQIVRPPLASKILTRGKKYFIWTGPNPPLAKKPTSEGVIVHPSALIDLLKFLPRSAKPPKEPKLSYRDKVLPIEYEFAKREWAKDEFRRVSQISRDIIKENPEGLFVNENGKERRSAKTIEDDIRHLNPHPGQRGRPKKKK